MRSTNKKEEIGPDTLGSETCQTAPLHTRVHGLMMHPIDMMRL